MLDNDARLLLATILLPLAGVALIATLARGSQRMARQIALLTSLVTLGLAGWLLLNFSGEPSGFAAIDLPWLNISQSGIDIRLELGLDGLSLWMFGLSALLMVTAVLVSWEAISDRAPAFYSLLLLLECGMLGVFAAGDIILFYIFFEFTLIPLFFLIGIWGSEERRYAAIKFFLFTFAGSVLTFLGLLAIVWWNYYRGAGGELTFSIQRLTEALAAHPIEPRLQLWIFLALFAGFAIKVPLFPLHTWLPLAHVQAPTAGSVILAGVLLKIGTYGFVRFSMPMLPDATAQCMPWILWLSVIGIIYGALVALAQTDIKRLIAYSSVSHLGFCMLGLFALNRLGMQGGVLQMINHGLSTGGLFAVVGMLYERHHTREIRAFGGLARQTPLLALFMLLFTFSSIGLPGLNGFAGEFLLLLGMFQRGWSPGDLQLQVISVLAVVGVILGAWYMLWLVERTFFGPLRVPGQDVPREPVHAGHGVERHVPEQPSHAGHGHHEPIRDLSFREVMALAPLVLFVVWIGVKPDHFLRPMAPTLDPITRVVEDRYLEQRGGSSALAGSGRAPDPLRIEVEVDRATQNMGNSIPGAAERHGGRSLRPVARFQQRALASEQMRVD